MSSYDCEKIKDFVSTLRAKATEMARKSEGHDDKKGFWQAGQAEGLGNAADKLEKLISDLQESERAAYDPKEYD